MNDLSNMNEQKKVEKQSATLSFSKALTTYRRELYRGYEEFEHL
jgi:hypothetical protein